MTAVDKDEGDNSEIRYFLPTELADNGKDMFAINQYNGDIFVKMFSFHQIETHFVLTVEAVDRGKHLIMFSNNFK